MLDGGLPNDYLEIYLPVRASNGTVIGAYEIYEDATSIVELIEATRRDVFIVAGLAATILLLMLWGAFNATSRTLASQNGRLVELAADLRGREAAVPVAAPELVGRPGDPRRRRTRPVRERRGGADPRLRRGRLGGPAVRARSSTTTTAARSSRRSPTSPRARAPSGASSAAIKHADGTWRTMEAIGTQPARRPGGRRHRHQPPRHHRAQGARGPAHAPGLPRRAHRAPQPRAVHRPRVARACSGAAGSTGASSSCSSTSTASRRSTTASGTPPATACSRRSASGCARRVRPGDTVARLGGDEFAFLLEDVVRPRGRRRRSPSASPTSLGAPLAVGGVEVARPGERRHRDARSDGDTADGPAARRRHRDVPAKARGERRARALRAGDARGGDQPLRARGRPAARDRAPGVRPPLPAGRRPAPTGGSSASRRSCAGSTRRAACCRRPAFIPVAEETGLIVADRALGARGGLPQAQRVAARDARPSRRSR